MALKLDNQSSIGTHVNTHKFVPGAGTYNANDGITKKRAGAYSIKGRYKDLSRLSVPGPGTYTSPYGAASPDKKRGATCKFGSSVRSGMPKTLGPGPGGYHIPCTFTMMPAHTNSRSKSHAYI